MGRALSCKLYIKSQANEHHPQIVPDLCEDEVRNKCVYSLSINIYTCVTVWAATRLQTRFRPVYHGKAQTRTCRLWMKPRKRAR